MTAPRGTTANAAREIRLVCQRCGEFLQIVDARTPVPAPIPAAFAAIVVAPHQCPQPEGRS